MKVSGNGAVYSPTDATQNFGPNWMVLILPFVDQGNLYNSVSGSINGYMTTGDASWRAIGQVTIPQFFCPSDIGRQTPWAQAGGGWARGNYACNAFGIHEDSSTIPGWMSTMGIPTSNPSVFLPQSPLYNPSAWDVPSIPNGTKGGGVMCINWGASLNGDDFKDGVANTILIGEVRMGSGINVNALPPATAAAYNPASDPRGTWAVGMPGASVLAGQASWDCTNPNDHNSQADDIGPGNVDAWQDGMGVCTGCGFQQAQARSRHPNGVVVAMADMSVRFVQNSISTRTWFGMGSRDDRMMWNWDN